MSNLLDLIVVMTCPRKNETTYLSETLAGLDAAGAEKHPHKLVVSDGGTITDCKWPVAVYPGPSGTKRALWRVFGLAARSGVRRLIIFEDDVIPCRNAVTQILRSEVPSGCAFMTFFDINEFPKGDQDPGIYKKSVMGRTGRGFWGVQAMLLPGAVVRFLADQDPTSVMRFKDNPHHSDIAMSEILMKRSPWKEMAIHLPCLVEHRGDMSAWGNPSKVRATHFPGVGFDALSLLPMKPVSSKASGGPNDPPVVYDYSIVRPGHSVHAPRPAAFTSPVLSSPLQEEGSKPSASFSVPRMKNEQATRSGFGSDIDSRLVITLGIMQRSGTNFLRSLLSLHPDCENCNIPEDHLVQFSPQLNSYVTSVGKKWGDRWGDKDQLWRSLGSGLARFAVSRCDNAERTDAFRLLMKTPSVDGLAHVDKLFPGACLLLIVRDGRDLIASGMNSFGWSFEWAVSKWNESALAIKAFSESETAMAFKIVRYEDLHLKTISTYKDILSFLKLRAEAVDMTKVERQPLIGSSDHKSEAGRVHWKPVEKSADFNPLGRWTKWPPDRIHKFNEIAGPGMRALGYL
jgi:hypothetical protein